MTKIVATGLTEKMAEYEGKTVERIVVDLHAKTGAAMQAVLAFSDGTKLEIKAALFLPEPHAMLNLSYMPTLMFGVETHDDPLPNPQS